MTPARENRSVWVYIRSEPGLWTVGFYDPSGAWHPDNDFSEREKAAERVAFLNGTEIRESINDLSRSAT